jgi:hypothetical protein
VSIYLAHQPDPAAVEAALAKEVVHLVQLLELRFASGTVYLSNETVPIEVDGHTWQGMGNLVSVATIPAGRRNLAPLVEYTLGIPWEFLTDEERGVNGMGLIPGLIGDPAEYRNREAILWEQILDDDNLDSHGRPTPIGVPSALHYGRMDAVTATYSPTAANLRLSVEGPFSRKGAPVFGRLTPRDQQKRYPGDNGLNYVYEVQNTVVEWTKP